MDCCRELAGGERTPVDAVADAVADAMRAGEIDIAEPPVAVALIFGIVLQTAVFHLYGRMSGPLSARAAELTSAAMAAVTSLSSRTAKRSARLILYRLAARIPSIMLGNERSRG